MKSLCFVSAWGGVVQFQNADFLERNSQGAQVAFLKFGSLFSFFEQSILPFNSAKMACQHFLLAPKIYPNTFAPTAMGSLWTRQHAP